MRAILFPSAPVASRTGRRSSTPRSQAPAVLFHCAARCTIEVAPSTSNLRISLLPALVIRPSRVLPPVECCRGTRACKFLSTVLSLWDDWRTQTTGSDGCAMGGAGAADRSVPPAAQDGASRPTPHHRGDHLAAR